MPKKDPGRLRFDSLMCPSVARRNDSPPSACGGLSASPGRGPASAPRGEAAAQAGGGRGRRGAAHLPPETRGGLRAFRRARGGEGWSKAAQGEIRRGAKGSPAPRGVRRGNNGAKKLTPRWRGRAGGRKGGKEKGRAAPPRGALVPRGGGTAPAPVPAPRAGTQPRALIALFNYLHFIPSDVYQLLCISRGGGRANEGRPGATLARQPWSSPGD